MNLFNQLILLTLFFCSGKVFASDHLSLKVIGGAPAIVDRPWIASLQYIGPNGQFLRTSQHFCGAVQISNEWLVTAAHCLHQQGYSPDELAVVIGRNDLSSVPRSEKRLLQTFMVHPDYNEVTLDNDLALLQLQKPFPQTRYAPVVSQEVLNALPHLAPVHIIGWGDTDVGGANQPTTRLQEATMDYWSASLCKSAFKNTGLTITNNMICSNGHQLTDTCYGDSGGPLIYAGEQGESVIGIVSWGIDCASPYPAVFSRLSNYSDWIQTQISGLTVTSPHHFGLWPIGTQTTESLTLHNSGKQAVQINSVQISGSAFTLIDDECSTVNLVAGGECTLDIQFASGRRELESGRAVIQTSALPIQIELEGQAAQRLQFSQFSLPDFLQLTSLGEHALMEQEAVLHTEVSSDWLPIFFIVEAEVAGDLALRLSTTGSDEQYVYMIDENGSYIDGVFGEQTSDSLVREIAQGQILRFEYAGISGDELRIEAISFTPLNAIEPPAPSPEPINPSILPDPVLPKPPVLPEPNVDSSAHQAGGGSNSLLGLFSLLALCYLRIKRGLAPV